MLSRVSCVCPCVSHRACQDTGVYGRILGAWNINIQNIGTYNFSFSSSFDSSCLLPLHLYHPVLQAVYLIAATGTTAAALEGLPLVTATDDAFLRVCGVRERPNGAQHPRRTPSRNSSSDTAAAAAVQPQRT